MTPGTLFKIEGIECYISKINDAYCNVIVADTLNTEEDARSAYDALMRTHLGAVCVARDTLSGVLGMKIIGVYISELETFLGEAE